jgi:hypothetical protein
MSDHGIHFETDPPISAHQRNTTHFPAAEKQRLDASWADADFVEAATRRDQIAVAEKHLRSFTAGHPMAFEAIGRFFGVSPAIIRNQMHPAKTPAKLPGRQSILSHEQRLWIADLLNSRTQLWNPITYSELLNRLESQHQVVLYADPLHDVVRNMGSVKTLVGRPMEAERSAGSPDEVSDWFDRHHTAKFLREWEARQIEICL